MDVRREHKVSRGDIVERVSGNPLDTFLRTRLLEPLGMADTSFELAADARARLVTVHQRVNGVLMERPSPDVARNAVAGTAACSDRP